MSTEYNFSEASEYGADLDYEDYLKYVSNIEKDLSLIHISEPTRRM